MTKTSTVLMLLLPLLLISAPASANIYVPSFVQFISAPLLWSIYVVTLVYTLPVIFGIAFIEALVLRRYAKNTSLWRLTSHLALINAITSLIGTVTMPTGTELWPGMPIAFALTVVLEALLLGLSYRKLLGIPSISRGFKASFWMNAASYSVLAIMLGCLIYIPSYGTEDPSIATQVRGRLLIQDTDDVRELDFDKRPSHLAEPQPFDSGDCLKRQSDGCGTVACGADVFRIAKSGSQWKRAEAAVQKPTKAEKTAGGSLSGHLWCCKINGEWMIYDHTKHESVLAFPARDGINSASFSPNDRYVELQNDIIDLRTGAVKGSCGDAAQFSPDSSSAAWIDEGSLSILNCTNGALRHIHIPGRTDLPAASVAWSPDSRFIAYLGHANPFTAQRWTPDVRVVEVRTGRSATVYRKLWTCGRPLGLVWLR